MSLRLSKVLSLTLDKVQGGTGALFYKYWQRKRRKEHCWWGIKITDKYYLEGNLGGYNGPRKSTSGKWPCRHINAETKDNDTKTSTIVSTEQKAGDTSCCGNIVQQMIVHSFNRDVWGSRRVRENLPDGPSFFSRSHDKTLWQAI